MDGFHCPECGDGVNQSQHRRKENAAVRTMNVRFVRGMFVQIAAGIFKLRRPGCSTFDQCVGIKFMAIRRCRQMSDSSLPFLPLLLR